MIQPLFAFTVFLGAALLFVIEPMMAKAMLPVLGGSPGVWNVTVMFFQVALLAGYGYAHLLASAVPRRVQVLVHCALTACAGAWSFASWSGGDVEPGAVVDSPYSFLVRTLALSVGLPFFAVSAAGPLLQRWFATTKARSAHNPYVLYAASNAGSLVGLLAYPAVIERVGTVAVQRQAWNAALVLFGVCIVACSLWTQAAAPPATQSRGMEPAPSLRQMARWFILALCPSSLLLGVTQYASTDLAAVPMLWVLPLALYLLTMIVAFSAASLSMSRITTTTRLLMAALAVGFLREAREPIALLLALHLAAFVAVSLVCHRTLAEQKPAVSHLTRFYFILALGGAAGGVFNGVVAPLVFDDVVEYPLALALACLFLTSDASPPRGTRTERLGRVRAGLIAASLMGALLALQALAMPPLLDVVLKVVVPVSACVLFLRSPVSFALGIGALFMVGFLRLGKPEALHQERTFFGVHRVVNDVGGRFRSLMHGTTAHSAQPVDPALRALPSMYYHPTGPLGRLFEGLRERGPMRIGVVGLGAGSIAAYGRSGDELVFFEIDPAVARIAADRALFTYLADTRAAVRIVEGDGRLTMVREPDGSFDLVILDAFSSDAIPIHMLTREAIAMVMSKVAPGGLMALHLSNRYLDLVPVVDAVARANGLTAFFASDDAVPRDEQAVGKTASEWAVVTRTQADAGPLLRHAELWRFVERPSGQPVWSDDASSILDAFGR